MLDYIVFWRKFNWHLLLLLMVSFVLRLNLVTLAVNLDLVSQAGWGQWIYQHGWLGFYENKIWTYAWPNHPPLISLVYGFGFKLFEWLNTLFTNLGSFIALNHLGASKIPWYYNFTVWFFSNKYEDTSFAWGELISLKLIPIIADIVLGYMVYKFVRPKANPKTSLLITALYLLSPFSWYESALWGQNDQLGLIFLLLSFWFLTKDKLSWLGPIVLATSIGLKPTAIIFGPLFLWFSLKNKQRFSRVIIGGIISLILYIGLAKLTSSKDVIPFSHDLYRQIFVKGELWTWIHSFNFWRLVTSFMTHYHGKFLWITYQAWGYLLFAGFNLYVFYRYRTRDWPNCLKALFITAYAGWLFIVTMHERYLFPAIVVGLILSSQNNKMLKYWLILSLIFSVNLFYGWWTPEITWLKNILTWKNVADGPIPKVLCLVNLIIFSKMLILTSKLTLDSKRSH